MLGGPSIHAAVRAVLYSLRTTAARFVLVHLVVVAFSDRTATLYGATVLARPLQTGSPSYTCLVDGVLQRRRTGCACRVRVDERDLVSAEPRANRSSVFPLDSQIKHANNTYRMNSSAMILRLE